ncbi:MAG: amidase [Myxococcales bacterium]|nr:amidase [Myxococcales bacterium]
MSWTVVLVHLLACPHPTPVTQTVDDPPPRDDIGATAWLVETSAAALAERLQQGELTSLELTEQCSRRIEATNTVGPELRAVIAVDPTAAEQAAARDAATERGPLHGLPVLLKDNIDAAGMPTTAGSLALANHVPSDDAFLVAQLRRAGAVILGKANLSEWANFRSTRSSSGWSGAGGQARNPHALDRTPCGSSSGSAVAVAAGLAPLAIGTETDGSVLCPASINGIVGVKPTIGLVSRDGIVPISHSQDTAGPMARTVADAAALLEVLAAADPDDPASGARPDALGLDYTSGLTDDALSGTRIGVLRLGESYDSRAAARFDAAVKAIESLGAEVVEVQALSEEVAQRTSEQEWEVLVHEFRPDLEAYLTGVDGYSTLEDLIAFNNAHRAQELVWFGQEIFHDAATHERDDASYQTARTESQRTMAAFVDTAVAELEVDAIVAPTTGPAWAIDWVLGDRYTGGTSDITAVSGYPAVTVPMGHVQGLPVGITFLGPAFSEATLLAFAHAYEQATQHRLTPTFAPTVREG